MNDLVDIPVIDAPDGPLQLARLEPARLRRVLDVSQELLPPPLLRWADRPSATWLEKSSSPYAKEIHEIARLLGRPGGYALNLNFEWGCTTGCDPRGAGEPMRIYRTLDWPFRLGSDVVVARHQAAAGAYYNVTWVGYAGVVTAVAPARFAAAINQAPMPFAFDGHGLTLPVDWLLNRWRVARRTALPPAHILRQAFETSTSYSDAKEMLARTPLCIPAILTLVGAKPGEGCVIERTEDDAVIHDGATAVGNHWLNAKFKGRARPIRSRQRQAKLRALLPSLQGDFDWLVPPILNRHTRLAAELSAGSATLSVQGWHGHAPQTRMLKLGPLR